MTTPTVPAYLLPHRTPVELVALSRRGLEEALATPNAAQRYAYAHLAALRAAAAVLAVRARPVRPGRRKKVTSVWPLLAMVAPELREWAVLFASGAAKRSSAEAGIARVTDVEADRLVWHAARFLDEVQQTLALPSSARPPVAA